MDDSIREMVEVLRDARSFITLPGNKFFWSRWENVFEATHELDGHIAEFECGRITKLFEVRTLFAPTGSIQEVSIDSGWGDSFIDLARRFDRAEQKLKAQHSL